MYDVSRNRAKYVRVVPYPYNWKQGKRVQAQAEIFSMRRRSFDMSCKRAGASISSNLTRGGGGTLAIARLWQLPPNDGIGIADASGASQNPAKRVNDGTAATGDVDTVDCW